MKLLKWLKENINLVSFGVGVCLLISGHDEAAKAVMAHGASL